jgi:predicted acylesterase/phospholipase RssA
MQPSPSIIYQAAKLGDLPQLRQDFAFAQELDARGTAPGRLYGNSSGALVALAHGIALAARSNPAMFTPQATHALSDFAAFFQGVRGGQIRRINWRGLQYGIYNLRPLHAWLRDRLTAYTGRSDIMLSELGVSVYLCTQDRDGFPVFFGPPAPGLEAIYHNCRTRVEDAPAADACIAALCTMLSTEPGLVNGHYYKDGRPAFPDISGMVLDMEAADPRPLIKSVPYVPLPTWPSNALTQPFIMHRWQEQNQAALTGCYNDLLLKHRELLAAQQKTALPAEAPAVPAPRVRHVDIPYIGSTELGTNMRQNQANKAALMEQFRDLGAPQLDGFDFARPFNLIYGAGGFSGLLGGLVMSRLVDARQANISRVYGCSAGVLNGLFHAVVLGARRHPELYTDRALHALDDLEGFFQRISPGILYRINKTPRSLYRALVNFGPLRRELARYLEAWTGLPHGESITFQDIRLPFRAAGARGSDGYLDIFGMPDGLEMRFAGRTIRPINCAIVDAVVGGMAQPFYITPPVIQGETYYDGGAAFYDIGYFAAALDPAPISLLNMHFCEPPSKSYGFDERPTLGRIAFDTHNFTFPEERRRMRRLVDLFYEHQAVV